MDIQVIQNGGEKMTKAEMKHLSSYKTSTDVTLLSHSKQVVHILVCREFVESFVSFFSFSVLQDVCIELEYCIKQTLQWFT